MKLCNYPVSQIAYFVDDIHAAAQKAYDNFGAGPFFIVEDIALSDCTHRGEACDFVHSSAYGQWGDLMLELVQQTSDGPSPFRDVYQPGESGLHHLATIVPDQQEAYLHYQQAGFEIATVAVTKNGTEFAFIDALKDLGHFIEVYEAQEPLLKFYDMVQSASVNWPGDNLLRQL